MDLGNKIKVLRLRAGVTQEMLAKALEVSFQTISKWENSVCAPDISMLPKLSIYFGVTIDELFDLTTEQRLQRIETMLDMEQELPDNTFAETVSFLEAQLEGEADKGKIYNLLAHTYHHRIVSDSDKVVKYARKALQLRPEIQDCQWLFQKAEGAVARDWNIRNHHQTISFFRELIAKNPESTGNYLHLLDNLIADHRTEEAAEILALYGRQKGHKELQVLVYQGRIAQAEHKVELAEQIISELETRFSEDGDAMFEVANYFADRCLYDKAVECYEASLALDLSHDKKPVPIDALQAIATIYEIQGQYEKAIDYYDKMLGHLESEFGFTEGEPVRAVMVQKIRMMEACKRA